jgi:hypothetical protein
MKTSIFFLLFAFNAMAEVMIVNVFRPTINPIAYTSQETLFLRKLINNPDTCSFQKMGEVFTYDYYLSKDQTTICRITKEYGKQRPEAYCGVGVKIDDSGNTSLVELIKTDANGLVYNMIREVLPHCPSL